MAEIPSYSSRPDNKRKFDDQTGARSPSPAIPAPVHKPTGFSSPIIPPTSGAAVPPSYNNVPPPLDGFELAKQRAQEIAARIFSAAEAKRPKTDSLGGANDSSNNGYGSDQSVKPIAHSATLQLEGTNPSFSSYGHSGSSKKIDIPSGRVGVIIGKSGETIKYLQLQSGAKIQITRDMDAEPNSQTRAVDIIGTPEQISKAEQLINDVISEASAGGSSMASGQKFTVVSTDFEHFSMKVPNNKVGLIIGKGGENIKSMQATSGARIQVIPLHLPPGDTSSERTVHIDGTKEQIELAKQLVNDATSENRFRNPQTGGYRPPRPPTNWVPSGAPPIQQPSYGYMQQPGAYLGPYPGSAPQPNTSQPPYGGYPPPPSSGWDQSANSPAQQSTQATGYDYYNQQQPQQQQQQQQQAVGVSNVPYDGNNYNYNQMTTSYNGDSTYSQSAVGYQQYYGQAAGYNQAGSTQEGAVGNYGVQGSTQQVPPGQQPTSQPAYGSVQVDYAQSTQSQPYAYSHQPTAPSGYAQDPQQLASEYGSQAGYGQLQSYAAAPQNQGAVYVQQQPQSYNVAYSATPYSQPSYSADGTHGTSAEPVSTNGVEKLAPQS